MFQLGDIVKYATGMDSWMGTVTHVEVDWVGVTMDLTAEGMSSAKRAFTHQGSYTPTQSSYRQPDRNGQLTLIARKEPDVSLEYPLEPMIGFGAFNNNGNPVLPGQTANSVGYGILNPPPGFYGVVFKDRGSFEEDDLRDYLAQAKVLWERQCRLVDWERVENKWATLAGCRTRDFTPEAGQIYCQIQVPIDLDGTFSSWHTLTIMYPRTMLSIGISSAVEVRDSLSGYTPNGNYAYIASVDGEVLTNYDGLKWTAAPRYQWVDEAPIWHTSPDLIKLLMANLDMQREKKDSERLAA